MYQRVCDYFAYLYRYDWYVVPDVHTGVGIVIGFSAPITYALNPSFVGVDIGCSITTYITNIPINKDDFPIIEHRIKKEIPMGMEINKSRQFEMKTFYKFMKSEFNKAQRSWPDMINDFDISEDGMQDFVDKFHMDYGKFCKSIGSILSPAPIFLNIRRGGQ